MSIHFAPLIPQETLIPLGVLKHMKLFIVSVIHTYCGDTLHACALLTPLTVYVKSTVTSLFANILQHSYLQT